MIEDPHLDDDARQALDLGEAVVRDVRGADGTAFRRSVEPYKAGPGGVIVTYHPAEAADQTGASSDAKAEASVEAQSEDIIQSLIAGTTQIGVWTLEADGSRFDWDERFGEITGLQQTGLTLEESGFLASILPEDFSKFERSLQALIQTGEAIDQELRFCPQGQDTRWIRIRGERTQANGGGLIAGILSDITERKNETERSDFMMRELDHRVKNLLAIILSIAEISARSNSDIETYKNDFRARLESMARTHNLLAQTQWSGSDLQSLVEEEVYSLIPKDAASINGAEVEISPSATQSLAMFFHELTVNALKHGALATDSGKVKVSWAIDNSPDGRLELKWTESGGGNVTAPAREGFGGKVINRIVKRQLDAQVMTSWDEAGMQLTASIPLANIAAKSKVDAIKA